MARFDAELSLRTTPIPGLVVLDLPVHGDARGWFKENWQRTKMLDLGLPDFQPVQNNISFNDAVGTTRGIHAEPWDKFVSVAAGRIFGAWVDLRRGESFGAVVTVELDPSVAVFVPRGVGNAYQTLEPETAYTYLVNDHWSPDADYTFLNLADETAAIPWPIPLEESALSAKDRSHPRLDDVVPFGPRRILVTGADGQLGRALRSVLGDGDHVEYTGIAELDLTGDLAFARHWPDYSTIINAAGYTAVDRAETAAGRAACWSVNVDATANLVRLATEHRLTVVHISSDYVFDGTIEHHREDEPVSPLGVYGQTKAAADALVSTVPRHYIVRTSWVIGAGDNFVRTMAALADRGIDPTVVSDQFGRLTFTDDLAAGIMHLLSSDAPFGTYNLTNTGPTQSWADIAKRVFELAGHDPDRVTPVSTADYYASVDGPVSARPRHSTLSLAKLAQTGFVPRDARDALREWFTEAR